MAEPNNNPNNNHNDDPNNAGNNGGGSNSQTFTQGQVDAMLAAERSKQPNAEEMAAFKKWQEEQKTDVQKNADRDKELAEAKNEVLQLKSQNSVREAHCRPEFVKFVTSEILALDGDFSANLKNYKKDNPQYFGEPSVRRTSTSGNLSGGASGGTTTNDIMNDLLRNRGN